MDLTHRGQRATFIWNIAKSLRGAYRPHDYGKVILPMTVLRRFDCVIAPTREDVWAKAEEYKGVPNVEELLFFASGQRIYNTSPFDVGRLLDDAENTAGHLREYLGGFSANAREILDRFDFDTQITKLAEKERLRPILARFVDVDLHPQNVPNEVMGHIFENLIRRFYELANEEAGDYFTPREVIRLMVDLIFAGDAEVLTRKGIVKTLYDPAAGLGGCCRSQTTTSAS
jgi:type I restriction enzyme M protein